MFKRFCQSDLYYFFSKDKVAIASFVVFAVFVLSALLTPWLAPYDVYDLSNIDILDAELPPSWIDGGESRFLLGTENQGRDILSTILYGLRTSLIIGLFAVCVQLVLGIVIGLCAGYLGGWLDNLLMRFADIQLSFSTLMVAILVSALFQSILGSQLYSQYAIFMLVAIIGIAEWPQYARTVRASVLAEKQKEYVEAAQVMGLRSGRIMFRHILPNCLSPILVISTVQIANAIMSEAALSFLGLGMPVDKPSLGSLIKIGFDYILSGAWWITAFPGLVLVTLVLVTNLLGDFLRQAFNPKIYKG